MLAEGYQPEIESAIAGTLGATHLDDYIKNQSAAVFTAEPIRIGHERIAMNVSLTPQLEKIVRAKIESGRYHSPGEVIREALWLLDAYDSVQLSAIAKLPADVEAGWQDIGRGRMSDFDSDEIKRRGYVRMAAQKQR